MKNNDFFDKSNFYIVTGGPGVGKTTLLEAIENEGFLIVPEVAREVIKTQMETGGKALPWEDTALYTELMLNGSVECYMNNIKNEDIIFFDRGILDTICYAGMIGLEVSPTMNKYAENYLYNRKVFILPPWYDIYTTDSERKQSWEEAKITYLRMKTTYEEYGYKVIDVPKDTVDNRKEFVLNIINRK